MAQPRAPAGISRASHGFKHEQNRRRRHIAEMTQDRARGGKRRLIEIERVLDGVKHGAAARVNGPEIEGGGGRARQHSIRCGTQRARDRRRDLAGKRHVEAGIADRPGDLLCRLRQQLGMKSVDGETGRLGADQSRGAAIGKHQKRKQPPDVFRLLKVKGAQLEADDQHLCIGGRAYDMASELQCVDRRIATHKADHRSLDGGIEIAAPHQFEVDARRGKSGAGRHDEMGDLAGRVAEIEPIDRLLGQRRRFDPIAVHPPSGRWKAAESVEAAGIDRTRCCPARPAPDTTIAARYPSAPPSGRKEAASADPGAGVRQNEQRRRVPHAPGPRPPDD